MSYFRRYNLATKTEVKKRAQSPGRYRKLTDEEVHSEWMRTRGKYARPSSSPEINVPFESIGSNSSSSGLKKTTLNESLLEKLKESSVDDIDSSDRSVDSTNANMSADIDSSLSSSNGDKDFQNDKLEDGFVSKEVERVEEFHAITQRHMLDVSFKKERKTRLPQQPVQVCFASRTFVEDTPKMSEFAMEPVTNDKCSAVSEIQDSCHEINSECHSPDDSRCLEAKLDLSLNGQCTESRMNFSENSKEMGKENERQSSKHDDAKISSGSSLTGNDADVRRDVSRHSACSLSDDDTLHSSVSSDEVNVYIDEGVKEQVTSSNEEATSPLTKICTGERSYVLTGAISDTDGSPDQQTCHQGDILIPEVHITTECCHQGDILIPEVHITTECKSESARNSRLSDQGLPGSHDVSTGTIDSLDGAIARTSHRSSIDSGTGSDPVRHHSHFVVVAIDFGTTYSGYAFSFSNRPEKIHMMRKWEGGDPGVVNQKTLTTLLLTPEGEFHSFGFTARDFYHNLKPQDAKKWNYFEKFKMVLHYSQDLSQEKCLRSSSGKLIPALAIFTFALAFFKNHALQELSDLSGTRILNEDVRWVITVPAIWRAPAKQFMRQAAYQAGIASTECPDQLLIALEPEAASVCCRRLRMHQVIPEPPQPAPRLVSPRQSTLEYKNTDQLFTDIQQDVDRSAADSAETDQLANITKSVESPLKQGTRYMVVDCGGGTVDITVHEIDDKNGGLKELYKATGGPYGSVGVDLEFEKLLCGIFGMEFIEQFRQKRPAGWDDLMIAFESRKRSASPDKINPLNVSLPFSMIDLYKKSKGGQVENAVKKYGDKDIRWSSQGMLRLAPDAMRRLFLSTVNSIKQSIGDVLNHPDANDLNYLFLVGGFAESHILQNEIREEFGHLVKMIIPQGVSLAILEGAVLFGWDPTVVKVRRSRLTYGIGVLNRFDPDKHPPEKKLTKSGVDWCTDVFEGFVKVNQAVAMGDSVLRSYTPAKPGQKTSIINIFCSENPDVEFVTDASVRKCGALCLDLSDTQYQAVPKRREIQTRMHFGDTEIKISALDVFTGKCVRAAIDFLSQ